MMLQKTKGGFEAAFADVSENGRERKTAAAADLPNLPCAVIKRM
jgi:hypothetical protein